MRRDLIGRGASRTFRLNTNYRSPAEVMDWPPCHRSCLPGRRTCRPRFAAPACILGCWTFVDELAETLVASIRQVADEAEGSIAVIGGFTAAVAA